MKTVLLKRLKGLEEVRAVESQPPIELQIGYLKKLPEEYTGERHVVTVGRAADGTYRWRSDQVRRQPVKTVPSGSSEASWWG